jgi:gamma-glutamyltranspeptidase
VLLQALNILENFDLQKMGYASADYLHTVTEALKLAYADRDTYPETILDKSSDNGWPGDHPAA